MQLDQMPLFTRLKDSRRILLAGAGGGFDIYCGIPLFLALRRLGKTCHLANLSFADLHLVTKPRLSPAIVEVDADSPGSAAYFPERFLCAWLRSEGIETVVHCFERTGVEPLTQAYHALVRELEIDAVVLIDGGTDSLMRGDEAGLGTPEEDIASILAVEAAGIEPSILVCLGFGVDKHHGVCHAQFLQGVAELAAGGAFLGAFSLLAEMPEAQRYARCITASAEAMPRQPSVVAASIVSALEGRFGDYHRTHRTRSSQLWINPLMTLYWAFELKAVAKRCLYTDLVRGTKTYGELSHAIEVFRITYPECRGWEGIPV